MIVVLGSGLSEWLLEGRSSGFHAASHGVKRVKDDSLTRSVMARMKVVNDIIFCFVRKNDFRFFQKILSLLVVNILETISES